MESGKQYEVIASDGNAMGFFLDGRLYEYLTSTCVGLMDKDARYQTKKNAWGVLKGTNMWLWMAPLIRFN